MHTRTILGIHLLLTLALATQYLHGCAAPQRTLPMPEVIITQGMVANGIEAKEIAQGRALAVTECGGCHRFYWPREYPPDAWADIIKKKHAQLSLNKTQRTSLTEYFVAASRAMGKQDTY